jgi:hypothetical protein
MSTRQDPAEQLLDVFVYAPLGLAMEAAELLPKLADKGRQRMGGKVTVARMVGELAVRQGQRRAGKLVERLREQQRATRPARPDADPPAPANGHGSGPAPASGQAATFRTVPGASAAAPTPPVAARPPSTADVGELAIPGYDTLSASQVVPRLEGLSGDELEAIRLYEEGHRARKTVLTRIDQLREPGS